MTNAIQKQAPTSAPAKLEAVIAEGDLESLSPAERTLYYTKLCENCGLDPLTRPFQYLRLQGKLTLYAGRGATDQLARKHGLSRKIVEGPEIRAIENVKVVYAKCEITSPDGRVDSAIATLPLKDPVNDLMKVETKAKRRATLSMVGLGMLDELELETIPAAQVQRVREEELNRSPSVVQESHREGTSQAQQSPEATALTEAQAKVLKAVNEAQDASALGEAISAASALRLPSGDPVRELIAKAIGNAKKRLTEGTK